jgi:hypothetical protein
MLFAARCKGATCAKFEHPLRLATFAVDFIERYVQPEHLFIESLGALPKVFIVFLCCDIGNAPGAIMTTITWLEKQITHNRCYPHVSVQNQANHSFRAGYESNPNFRQDAAWRLFYSPIYRSYSSALIF